jgi:prevent-host-death family protein
VKNRLFEVVDRLKREHGRRLVITEHGRPVAVLMSVGDLESLEETLDVLNDEPLMADICEALAECTSNPRVLLTKDEALQLLHER